ncbi:FecR domain-containing protein [Sphingosinicella sp. LHD-64]|uniref:FecR family protein n=1 Tax=Sphingosinicella sp. LHD-64 TaxID=3072139 RepID=UPI0028105EE9|nr:FecR domain-containing protein [Sphingosinicella sp. LHD-64]MDQ8757409.1 FecR domain-containing protein [Sphingosinicella sp. LHD-64]
MNEPTASPTMPDDPLTREAADWFARMRGPKAEANRAAFEAWLARGAAHRRAYNRAAEIFALGKLLADAPAPAAAPQRHRALVAAAVLCALGLTLALGWFAARTIAPGGTIAASGTRQLATRAGETRTMRLPDGSRVRLDGDTLLEVDMEAQRRRLRLARGAARFEVARGPQPFVVRAGTGWVTARGTVFEVALRGRRVEVRLFEGAIDVALPAPDPGQGRAVRRLAPGEAVAFAADPATASDPPRATPPTPEASSGPATRDYDAVTLAELVAEANRSAARPIRLTDAAIGQRRVSGRFRIDDSALLADRLASLFDLAVDRGDPQVLVLRRR